jgi:hypothetical protein
MIPDPRTLATRLGLAGGGGSAGDPAAIEPRHYGRNLPGG